MATDTPPPYFPQTSLSPADPNRFRKFKLIIALVAVVALLALGGIVTGAVYLIRALF